MTRRMDPSAAALLLSRSILDLLSFALFPLLSAQGQTWPTSKHETGSSCCTFRFLLFYFLFLSLSHSLSLSPSLPLSLSFSLSFSWFTTANNTNTRMLDPTASLLPDRIGGYGSPFPQHSTEGVKDGEEDVPSTFHQPLELVQPES
jgi:glucan phosphoethanolaminetransferase (alkaline phosphatase superfamily)